MREPTAQIHEPAVLKYFERLLIVFAIGLILISLYFLIFPVSLRSLVLGWPDESGGVPVGEVASQTGDVKRKGADAMEFIKTQPSDTVFNYDTIITGPNAGTTLKLKDGSEIELGPKTMIRIFYEDQAGITGIKRLAGVNVISGEVQAKSAKPTLKVLAEGAVIPVVEKKTVAVAPPTLEKVFNRKMPELEAFRRDIQPKVATTAPKSRSVPQIRVVTPSPNAVFRPSGQNFNVKQTIPFQWIQSPKELPATLELYYVGLAKTPGVEPKLLLTRTIESGVESRKINFTVDRPGIYEWRMTLPETEISQAKSLKQEFVIARHVEMIELQMPEMDAATSVYTGKHMDDFNMAFRWRPLPEAESYVLQVYADPGLKRLLYEKEIVGKKGEARNDNLIKGSQYFTVQAKMPNGYIATSKVGRIGFEFVPPVLAFPKDASSFQKAQLQSQQNQILFTWRKTNFTERYTFQISNSPRFDRIVYEVRPEGNFTVVKRDLPKGTYYWRVSSLGKGTSSDPSKPNRFEIR